MGGSDTHELNIGSHQSRSHLRTRENSNIRHPDGRREHLNCCSRDGEAEIIGSVHPGRNFVRNFDVMLDLINGSIRIRNPVRKVVKRPLNRITTDESKIPFF